MAESYTKLEIFRQPELWAKVVADFVLHRSKLTSFLQPALRDPNVELILMGAGSSAFTGEMAVLSLQALWRRSVRAVATTDMVTHGPQWLDPRRPTVVISIARSGNSPESVAAVETVRRFHPEARHLIVTCNAEGSLARMQGVEVLLLPPETNDQGLAMTGSVTGMLLQLLLLAGAQGLDKLAPLAQEVLGFSARIQALAVRPFDRVVCLGSGPFLPLAREAQLKVQELSDGAVIGLWDSPLGFRHGPQAVVHERTLVLMFCSTEERVFRYECDLAASVRKQKPLALMAVRAGPIPFAADLSLELSSHAFEREDYLTLPYLVAAQLLALHKSEALGLEPDTPSRRGAIHRVVQGVTIYPWS